MSSEKSPGKAPPGPPAGPCEAFGRRGTRCTARARYGDPPRWCANHDPDQAERRAAAGRKRRPRFGGRDVDPRSMPTADWIVDYALDVAERVEQGRVDAGQGRAVAQLLGKAIDGLKARGSVGDLQPKPDSDAKPGAPEPAKAPLESLEDGLDS